MKEQPDNQWLEELLKEDESYIENDGFSRAVLKSLPKRKRMTWSAKRRLTKAFSAILGLVCCVVILSGIELDLGVLHGFYSTGLMTFFGIGVTALVTGFCLWVVFDRA
jgi:hypothetical protein